MLCSLRADQRVPPLATSIPNHVPPYLPNAPATVTALGPYGYGNARPSNVPYRNPYGNNGGYHGRRNGNAYGYGYGYGAALPFYYLYPSYDYGYDTGGGGGPYMYSGPPTGQAAPGEQTLHIVIDQPPSRPALPRDEVADEQPALPAPAADMRPGVPTVLVFRDGRQQEVMNYAIMGQTVYVFGDRTKKISFADLDIPATIKVNDDQGVQFAIPKSETKGKPAKNTALPSAPVESPRVPTSVATVMP